MSSTVLSLVIVVSVVAACRRRRPRRANAVRESVVAPAGLLARRTLQAIGAALAAGALLVLFGQQASAQSEPPVEPPPPVAAPAVPADPGPQGRAAEAPVAAPSASPTAPAPEPPVINTGPPPAPEQPSFSPPAPPAAPSPPKPAVLPTAAPTVVSAPTAPQAPTPTAVAPSPPPAPAAPVAPVAASTTWSIALAGRATIGSDGSTVWLTRAGVADEWRSASEILDILVSGGDTDDELVIGGPIGRRVSFRGGGGRDGLVMPAQGATARVSGQGAGEIVDSAGGLLVSFGEVEDLSGGPGADTFLADGPGRLGSLTMGPTDRLLVDVGTGTGSSTDVLDVGAARLDGTLEVRTAPGVDLDPSDPLPFLSFDTSSGDFTRFRGLDQGGGAYLRPELRSDGYVLAPAALPDGVTVDFPTVAGTDDFYAFLSGKANHVEPGTAVTIEVGGHAITGALTVGGTAESATLDLAGATLHFGPVGDAPLTLHDDAVTLTLTRDDLSGQLRGPVTSMVPGLAVDGEFTVDFDSDDGQVRAVGRDVTVTVGGRTLAGVDVELMVVGSGADHQVLLIGPDGAVVAISVAGVGDAETVRLVEALERLFGESAVPVAGATVASGPVATATSLPDEFTESASSTRAAAPDRFDGADRVISTLDTLSPLLALAGVAGTFLVVAGGGARTATSGYQPAASPLAASPQRDRDGSDPIAPRLETLVVAGTPSTVQARGPPAVAVATTISSLGPVVPAEDLLPHHDGTRTVPAVGSLSPTPSDGGIPGALGPFLVTTTGTAGVESGRDDGAPVTLVLLSSFVLFSLVTLLVAALVRRTRPRQGGGRSLAWTRGRRSTRSPRPCRRRAPRPGPCSPHVTTTSPAIMASPAVRTPAAPWRAEGGPRRSVGGDRSPRALSAAVQVRRTGTEQLFAARLARCRSSRSGSCRSSRRPETSPTPSPH